MALSTDNDTIPRRKRISCGNCGYRVPADTLICPHCRADPRKRRLKWSTTVLLIVGALLFVYLCGLTIKILPSVLSPVARLEPTPSQTPTLASADQAIEQTPTITPITLPPTLPPSATPTVTSRFSPTPTRRGAPTTTPTLTVPTPILADYAAPKLTAPPNAGTFSGANANIGLEWQGVSAAGLRENEWYQITVSYSSRNGVVTQTVWSRETRWQIKKEWWGDAAPTSRTFSWTIQVMRVDGADPYASPNRTPASPPSDTFRFTWQ